MDARVSSTRPQLTAIARQPVRFGSTRVTNGDVGLDGLKMGAVFQWPGAIHQGRGKCQPFVDERADDRQREAILKIMSSRDRSTL